MVRRVRYAETALINKRAGPNIFWIQAGSIRVSRDGNIPVDYV